MKEKVLTNSTAVVSSWLQVVNRIQKLNANALSQLNTTRYPVTLIA
jgi:hypothetical protein